MLRTAFAILSGIFAAMIAITFVEMINAKVLFPLPAGFDFKAATPEQLKALVDSMPLAARVAVVGGWLLGAFAGGTVAASIALREKAVVAGLVPGVLVALATIANAMMIPHPWWMPATGIVLAVPMAGLGVWLAQRLRKPAEPDLTWKGGDR